MKRRTFPVLLAFCSLPWCSVGAANVVVELEKAPVAIAQITPTQVILPAGAPGYYYPSLFVGGDTTAGGSPSRLVFEFSLAEIARAGDIESARFSATAFGGSRAMGTLNYALFGYAATGSPDLGTGTAGTQLAGPFSYDIDFWGYADLTQIDVTDFVRSLVASGATHAGLVFRDINTPANFRTDQAYIVVQDSPYWAGDVPPKLALTLVPEPQVCQLIAAVACAAALRRRRVHG
ncbi:MAG: hypothetical protein MUF04_01365 [Akkermansiaceae bacterium]|jgi:hypothetical protein|nr:hypothetical protein [Akkermansiaceae bacterium]